MVENEPLVHRFTRYNYDEKDNKRRGMAPLNIAAFNAGVVEAFLCSIGFVS